MADFYLQHLVIHPLDEEGDKLEAEEDVQDKTLEGDEDCQENEDGDILEETLEVAGDSQEDEYSLEAFVVDYLHKGEALLESGYKVGVWRSGFRIIDLGMLFKVKKISFTFDAFMPYEEEGNNEESEKPIGNNNCERDVINGEEQDDEAKTEESDIQDDSSDKEPFTLKTVGEPFTKILTAINESSKKNQIFESVSREFKGIASDIETTIMFASAGTLIPEEDSDFKGGVEGEEIDEDDDGKVLLFFVEMVSPVDEQEKEEAILQLAHLRTTAPKVLVKFLESKLTIIYEDADRSLSPEV